MKQSFPKISKAQWLAKVEKDLRGKPMNSLNFKQAGETMSPFWHRDDQPHQPATIVQSSKETCKTGISLEVNDVAEANKVILDLLNKGANALLLFSDSLDIEAEKESILKDVLLEFVDVYFQTNAPEERLFSPQYAVFSAVNTPAAEAELPQRFAEALRQAEAALSQQPTAFRPVFWVSVDDDYLGTIASLRALRLCYQLIAAAYDQPGNCNITADPFTKLTDKYSGMISTSAICTAAIIGGANTVFSPSGATDDPREKTFLRRVAINGMNIIDHEAYLNRVTDPAAGSYYLEALTDSYAQQIWAAFQQLVAK